MAHNLPTDLALDNSEIQPVASTADKKPKWVTRSTVADKTKQAEASSGPGASDSPTVPAAPTATTAAPIGPPPLKATTQTDSGTSLATTPGPAANAVIPAAGGLAKAVQERPNPAASDPTVKLLITQGQLDKMLRRISELEAFKSNVAAHNVESHGTAAQSTPLPQGRALPPDHAIPGTGLGRRPSRGRESKAAPARASRQRDAADDRNPSPHYPGAASFGFGSR